VSKPVRRIAVVGTGAIGSSWAAFYLARGFDVVATDPVRSAESDLRRYIDTAWPALAALGVSSKASPEHLDFTRDLRQAVSDADFIQENTPDREELKIRLFADMDAVAPPDSIIASSSSLLTMTSMQSACNHPQRCVIGHPFNSAHIIPLVEVTGGVKTAPETIQQTLAFYASIGKKPIHLRKEIAGHAASRMQAALYREVAYLIDQGVLDVADADAAVCWGPGLRWGVMGPNLLLLLGAGQGGVHQFMEHLDGPMTACWKQLGNPELTPKLKQTIIDGVLREIGNRSVEQLGRERDELLLGLLRLRAKYPKASASSTKVAGARPKKR
jgi:3-hydroxyacyl-CoA dehydrogenase